MTKNKEEPSKVGRKTLYKPEYCEQLIEHMKQGLSFDSFAGTINDNGVHVDTTYGWVEKHQEFSDAKKRGQALTKLYWDKLALLIARGKKHIDKKTGEVIVDPKNIIPSIFIFTMKNRVGWRDVPVENSNDNDKNKLVINRFNVKKEDKK